MHNSTGQQLLLRVQQLVFRGVGQGRLVELTDLEPDQVRLPGASPLIAAHLCH